MGHALTNLPDIFFNGPLTHGVWDDFTRDIDTAEWVATLTDSGTATVGDAVGGILALAASDGTVADNDEAYIEAPNETIKFAANKPFVAECRLQFTEANTDDANVIFGVADAVGANTILDDGGGPKASYSGAVFFKVDGGTRWNVEASIAGTQTTVELTAANELNGTARTAGGASYQKLRIEFVPYSATNATLAFYIDDVLVYRMDFVYTSATEMQLFAGVKNGDTNMETLNIDYLTYWQKR